MVLNYMTKLTVSDIENASHDGEAEYQLGLVHFNGDNESDTGFMDGIEKARHLWLIASVIGHTEAQYMLAMEYYYGDINIPASIDLFTKASHHGHDKAMFELGLRFKFGNFLPQDNQAARRWFKLSSSLGNTNAVDELESQPKM